MVGGEGPTTMAVAARQSDWWNMLHRPAERRREVLERLARHELSAEEAAEAIRELGRDIR